MLIDIQFKGASYEVSLYRELKRLKRGPHHIKSVELVDGHIVMRLKGGGKHYFHINRLSGRLLTSIGDPIKINPAGYGWRWLQLTNLKIEVIAENRRWSGLKEEDVRNI